MVKFNPHSPMILPIYVYGTPVLREPTEDVEADSDTLQQLIDDMIDTLHGAAGIGLAAPQVGRSERLFVVDLTSMLDDLEPEAREALPPQPMVFINPEIVEESDGWCEFEEGCLSMPDLREPVARPERVRVRFLDRHFQPQELEVGSLLARVIQHENDHLDGVLFIDHLSALRRRLLKRRLREMASGNVEAEYPLATQPV